MLVLWLSDLKGKNVREVVKNGERDRDVCVCKGIRSRRNRAFVMGMLCIEGNEGSD